MILTALTSLSFDNLYIPIGLSNICLSASPIVFCFELLQVKPPHPNFNHADILGLGLLRSCSASQPLRSAMYEDCLQYIAPQRFSEYARRHIYFYTVIHTDSEYKSKLE